MSQPSKVRKFAKMVLERTGGGASLLEFLVKVADGEYPEEATMRDRLEATKILLDRGLGKAPIQVDVSGQVQHVHGRVDVARLSDEDLAVLRKTLRRAVVTDVLPAASASAGEAAADVAVVGVAVAEAEFEDAEAES